MDYINREIILNDWITFLLLGCLILYSVSKYLYPLRFQEFILLPITNKYFLVQGKNNEIRHPFNILLFASQIISVSLLIYLIIKVSSPETVASNAWLFIQICTAYATFVMVKYYVEKIVSVVFSLEPLFSQYLYEKITYRNLLAIVVFLANLVFYFIYEPTLTVLLVFLGIIVIINTVTIFYSYKMNGKLILANFFYFILYLCALEISPYFILYKLFINQGDF